jgi:hypothetical protein
MTDIFPDHWSPIQLQRATKILNFLVAACHEKRRCPPNVEMASTLVMPEIAVGRVLRDMSDAGIIEVLMYGTNWRQIIIKAGSNAGQKTASPPSGNGQPRPYYATPADKSVINLEAVMKATCEAFSVEDAALAGRDRQPPLVMARNVACWVAYRGLGVPAAMVGKRLNRDQTTIMMTAKAGAEASLTDDGFRDMLERVSVAACRAIGTVPPALPTADSRGQPAPSHQGTPTADQIVNVIRRCAARGHALPALKDFAKIAETSVGYTKIVLLRMLSNGEASLRHDPGDSFYRLKDGTEARVTKDTIPFERPNMEPRPIPQVRGVTPLSPKTAPEITTIRRIQADQGPLPPARTCQWLDGEPRDRNFCGEPSQPGSSYCAEHHARCWYKAPGKATGSVETFHLFKQHKPSGKDARF